MERRSFAMHNHVRKILAVGAALLCGLAASGRAVVSYEVRGWREWPKDELTPLGRRVLSAGGPWIHAESAHFILHAASEEAIASSVGEAEFSLQKAMWYVEPARARVLSVESRLADDSHPKAQYFIIEKPRTWRVVQKAADPSKYSLAMQLENDVFTFRDTNAPASILRVPHEMAHLAMWRVHGRRLPLWLEEGTAAYVGWRIAETYHTTSGRVLVRALPPVKAEDALSLAALTAMRRYPETHGAGVAFYRGAEELVRAIARKTGDDRLGEFLQAVAAGTPWRDVLRERFGFSPVDFQGLENEVREKTLSETKD